MDLMATWEQRVREPEEKALAGKGIPKDTPGALPLAVCRCYVHPKQPLGPTPR